MDTPSFINRDPDLIMQEIKSQMETLLGREIYPAQFEQLILQCICYREILLLERFNAGMSQLLYQFSTAPILDYIAALVAVERLPAAYAGCIVKFTFIQGHGNIIIPADTRIASSNNTIFATTEDILVQSNDTEARVFAEAQEAGADANGFPVGDVTKILDPVGFVTAVTNTTTTSGGSDSETDESLRERIKLAPSQYSTAGSRQSYIFHAKSANPAIIDISVSSPEPGTVKIVPLTEDEEYETLIQQIDEICNSEKVRPLTDTVIVEAPVAVRYNLEVDITLYAGSNAKNVSKKVYQALEKYTNEKSRKLGQDIIISHITQICRLPEVYDISVTHLAEVASNGHGHGFNLTPANLTIDFNQVPKCTGITVTVNNDFVTE